ncbi:phosphatidylserine decarboxylase [Anaeromyxobacter oryzae]|uniref:Phosphatidylserine decarboxylase proenzyme n=1 Tax=Anaeromyxobacter oryzae TaxID=2918170 RepID=A0ABM7WP92_9BACT|nr:phosphatidylserine decarboxylase [Anaeromyxobacter oryzae]BDG01285.1 phosphatidylserine decarboxylase proenzyme [Anaeromyxobacter oryzae]
MEAFLDWLHASAAGRRLRPLLTRSRALHAAVGALAGSRASAPLVPWLVSRYGIDLSDAVIPPGGFPTLNALFTRALAPGARPIDPDPDALVSPADARLLVTAPVGGGTRLVVKGVAFDLATLVADAALARTLAGGSAAIFRLYVADCHRLVFPCAGVPSAPRLVPGGYGSVSPRPGNEAPFYVLNRRTVTTLEAERFGRLVLVDVGGFLVGSIRHLATPGVAVAKGAPRSAFAFGGSTLVLLAGPGVLRFDPAVVAASARGAETAVRIGRAIAWATAPVTPALSPR